LATVRNNKPFKLLQNGIACRTTELVYTKSSLKALLSQHFIFFVTFKKAKKAREFYYTRLERQQGPNTLVYWAICKLRKNQVFASGKPFQLSLMFVGTLVHPYQKGASLK
jgi:hypothetical protein